MLRLTDGMSEWWFRAGLEYPTVAVFAFFAVFVFGSCLGSFLNVCIWRLPLGESVVTAPSHCTRCGYEIRWYDNIPIVSYLVLRGRCRCCREPYSCRYLVVEALTGVLFVLAFVKVGLADQPICTVFPYWAMILLAVAASWIDAEHRLIPDALTIPAMCFGVAVSAVCPSVWGIESRLYAPVYALISGAIPALFLALFAIIGKKLTRKEVLGWGDVTFIAAVGMLLGLPAAFFAVAAGSLAGTFYGIGVAAVLKRPVARVKIAFGPFLAGAALVWLFAGEKILRWYLVHGVHLPPAP